MRSAIIYSIILLLFCTGCGDKDTSSIAMKDGNIINVESALKYYTTEEDFVCDVKYPFACNYIFDDVENIDFETGKKYSIGGFNQEFSGSWEMAVFGNWARDYGLIPEQVYYVATKVYVKYVSRPDNGDCIVPEVGGEQMGYRPGINQSSFYIINNPQNDALIFCTGVRLVGYDVDRDKIDYKIPNLGNTIKWNFLVTDDGWE